ncbi:MAG: von Willebrand factor type A domain-containing protein [Anaerolineales bacterium]|nr:von Willebrand factor type A domain-containing protein [Anaerolineales bacterium]
MNTKIRALVLGISLLVALVACQPQTQVVEVTRIVTETETIVEERVVEVEGETVVVEVTRVVQEEVAVEDVYDEAAGAEMEEEYELAEEPAAEYDYDTAESGAAAPAVVAAAPTASPAGTQASSLEESQLPATPEPPGGTFFEDYGVNPFIATADDNLSTFAIDVDTGAYTVMRRYVTDSLLPPADSVRVEEYINYFDQQYPLPQNGAFGINIEAAPAPYGENDSYHLVRVGIQGYDVDPNERPDAMLIFVIDVSGSMEAENRLGLVKESLHKLTDSLKPTDQIGIVAYGSTAEIILAPTYVVADRQIHQAIDNLYTNGSTNAEQGIMLAYQLADQFGVEGNINRLIVASDGVANVGNTTAEMILNHARNGVQLSTFGFGMGNYNDVLMEQLADQGDGSYAYIDTLEEADRVFSDQLLSTILTIAKDAKIQVEFNANVVEQYRLIGYENRDVADADFRNDSVDAGEIGAGHSVTALYEVRFAPEANPNEAAMTVRVRYQDPSEGEVQEIAQSMAIRDVHGNFSDASMTFQLSANVAEFAEILRQSYWAQDGNIDVVAADVRRIANMMPDVYDVQELAGLVAQTASMLR